MMDSTKGPDSPSNRSEGLASVDSESLLVVPSTTITAPPNRSLGSRPQRSRKGFASGKSRLSLKIDADCATSGDVVSSTRQSTPASTSSSCSSDVVPWWEVEYQCPPPGHLGAHVVPVSADEQHTDSNNSNVQNTTTRSAAPTLLPSVSVDFSTSSLQTTTSSSQKANAIRAGIVLYETPEGARRGTHSKLSALRSSVPCLLVDSSPSQKRKMRPQDPTDCEVDLFSTPVTKELKRFHESRYFNFCLGITPKLCLKCMHLLSAVVVSRNRHCQVELSRQPRWYSPSLRSASASHCASSHVQQIQQQQQHSSPRPTSLSMKPLRNKKKRKEKK
ncbi:hypothetical protein F442_19785 [Phytophthora nicotianae P10297]|uniref:Uncharacterized protein n=1 Tax=Phytophthora nicotianae P10297 TaxID=1317064 RepID=W2YAX0_PHYNI|nr:hypothetical protein F442_19785 [Phytophthora nicotianae P10297]